MRGLFRMTLAGAAVTALMVFGLVGTASAFHGGGVAHCDGCHSMHNSADNPISGTSNNQLLKGSDPSSTCLNCHNGSGGRGVNSTDGSNVNQGGDYFWVTLDYSVVIRGNTTTFLGDNHGHNVIAVDYGLTEDLRTDNESAPGGTYDSSYLGCTSCHDPHGQVAGGTANGGLPVAGSGSTSNQGTTPPTGTVWGNYRLLGDTDYDPPGPAGAFTNAAPIAKATNISGANYGSVVDYGTGMSEWCQNCHPNISNTSHQHPAGSGEFLNGQATNYNSYRATGVFLPTPDQSTSYDGLVPFERGAGATLSSGPFTNGPDSTSNVMCLTCHRSHASAHANAGKWDFEVELLTKSHALVSPDVPVGAAVYYKDGAVVDITTEYGAYQRSLCNKCHVKD